MILLGNSIMTFKKIGNSWNICNNGRLNGELFIEKCKNYFDFIKYAVPFYVLKVLINLAVQTNRER